MLRQSEFDQFTKQSEQTIAAKVLCDSVNPLGNRLTTMELTYPRCIHSEFMTHRMLSRNSASSRAIPMAKMLQRVFENPFFPLVWGKNQKGMQHSEELTAEEKLHAGFVWMQARTEAMRAAERLMNIDVHKQIGNRIVEPWMWITVICSATQWENFFALRCHPAAEPHIQNLAYKMRDAYDASTPMELQWGQWHLPLVMHRDYGELMDDTTSFKFDDETIAKISAGRCARVSYLTHDGKRDPHADVDLCCRLTAQVPLHASPLEHPAMATEHADPSNFGAGWQQLRKTFRNENVTERSRG